MLSFIRDFQKFIKARAFRKDVFRWQDEKFPQRTANSIVEHLRREVYELQADINNRKPDHVIASEVADVQLLFWCLVDELGLDPVECAYHKFHTDLVFRKWGKPDEHGVVEHIKDDE